MQDGELIAPSNTIYLYDIMLVEYRKKKTRFEIEMRLIEAKIPLYIIYCIDI